MVSVLTCEELRSHQTYPYNKKNVDKLKSVTFLGSIRDEVTEQMTTPSSGETGTLIEKHPRCTHLEPMPWNNRALQC
jgi:hypothetical protein